MSITRNYLHLIAIINVILAFMCFFWPIGLWQAGLLGFLEVAFILLYFKARGNIIGIIFLLIHAYYSVAFVAEFLSRNQIDGNMAFLGTLISFGMQPERDLIVYVALVALFKYGLVYGLGFKAQDKRSFARITVPWKVLVITCSVMWLMSSVTGAAITVLALRGTILALLGAVYLACWKRFSYGFFGGIALLIAAFAILVTVTRSRLEFSSLLLLFLIVTLSKSKRTPWHHLGLVAVLGVLLTNFYGALRDSDQVPAESYFQSTVITEGESGNILLLGAFVIGQDISGQLPASLNPPTLERLRILIPGLPNKVIMADQFMAEYLPAVAETGGGFAYSIVADLYVWGGVMFIIICGLAGGKVLVAVRSDVISLAFFFMVILQLYRQELTVSILTLLGYSIVRGLSFALVAMRSRRRTYPERLRSTDELSHE
jgi:hypothetical protein